MSKDAIITSEREPVGWYEETIRLRGCRLSVDVVKDVYSDLHAINQSFGAQVIADLPREQEMSDAEWDAHKSFLLENAFCLTTTVSGLRDQQLYGETADIFENPNLPNPIKSIFFTNINSFGRNAGGQKPRNTLEVFLDFSKPDLFDPNPLVSAATPNESYVKVKAEDITFYNAVQRAVETKLTAHKTWYGAIHHNFVYDVGMWFIALPVALYFSAYFMDQVIPVASKYELFRWPLFAYFVGLSLLFYRALTAYAKWAFPVNILTENKDRALRHRLALGGIASWLVLSIASTVYGFIVG